MTKIPDHYREYIHHHGQGAGTRLSNEDWLYRLREDFNVEYYKLQGFVFECKECWALVTYPVGHLEWHEQNYQNHLNGGIVTRTRIE